MKASVEETTLLVSLPAGLLTAPPANLSVFWLLLVLLFLCFSDSAAFSREQHIVMARPGESQTAHIRNHNTPVLKLNPAAVFISKS